MLEIIETAAPTRTWQVLAEAQAFVERNNITAEVDYYILGMNPWQCYERFKIELGKEMARADIPAEAFVAEWGRACRQLAEVLKI